MDRVSWALVGTSAFATDWIARGIRLARNAELVAVVSRDPNRARQTAERLGAPLAYTSIEAIENDRVDGVAIVTPNKQHAPLAVAAARRGLHVIVEKPMAPTVEECVAMIRAAREAGTVLAVAHCTHWSPPVARARELVSEGAIGEVIEARIGASFDSPPRGYWRQTDPTEEGGGPLFDMGVHAIDVLQSVVGPISEVAAFLDHRVHHYAAEDSTTSLFRFESGAHGVLESNFNCGQNDLEIVGSEGRLQSSAWLGREFSGDLRLLRDGEEERQELGAIVVYEPQVEHVSDCVLSGGEPVISGERGMLNVAVIRAAIESARSGRVASVRIG